MFIYSAPAAVAYGPATGSGPNKSTTTKSSRAVDREGSLALGFRGGSYFSRYDDGGEYSDFGLGVSLRYRPAEALGLELAWEHHDETWDTDTQRITEPLQASVEVFAFPWARVSPYALAGVTWTNRSFADTYTEGLTTQTVELEDTLFGPHGGVGIEFAIGDSAALDFEARYTSYLNVSDDDPSYPASLQSTMGVQIYF